MCGIIGYIGKDKCIPNIISGLESLEYRGYDSSGIAYMLNDKIKIEKEVGKINAEIEAFKANAEAQVEKGNKAAGARARKAALDLMKDLKEFRKLSVEAAKKAE